MNMNPMQIMGQVKQFRENMLRQNPGMNPQKMVNQMVSSGKVSQQQFEQARSIVESLGMKF